MRTRTLFTSLVLLLICLTSCTVFKAHPPAKRMARRFIPPPPPPPMPHKFARRIFAQPPPVSGTNQWHGDTNAPGLRITALIETASQVEIDFVGNNNKLVEVQYQMMIGGAWGGIGPASNVSPIVFSNPGYPNVFYRLHQIPPVQGCNPSGPAVAQLQPPNGATVSGTITLSMQAADSCSVTQCQFQVSHLATFITTNVPALVPGPAVYSVAFDTKQVESGTHTLICRAYNADGVSSQVSSSFVVSNTPGQFQWVVPIFTTGGNAIVTGLAADSAGNIIAGGYWNGSADFGQGPTNAVLGTCCTDGFLAKYSSVGSIVWWRRIGSNGNDSVKSVAIDSHDNIFVVGNFANTVDFGCYPLTTTGFLNMFCAKYNSSGVCQWATNFPGITSDVGATLAIDASDNAVILGDCGFNANFGGFPMTPVGGPADIDAALGKVNGSTGVTMWAKRFGGVNSENARSVAVDKNGDIVTTGYFLTSTDLGGGTTNGHGSFDIWLSKYSGANGNYIWGRVFGGSDGDYGYGVTTDPVTGNVIMTGHFTGGVDFGHGTVFAPGAAGVFFCGYDGSGNWLWNIVTGGGNDNGSSVTTDRHGRLLLGGTASSALYFGGSQSVFGNGQNNGYGASFLISGSSIPALQWIQYYGQTTDGGGATYSVAFDLLGDALIGGTFLAHIDFGGGVVTAGEGGYGSGFISNYKP